MAQELANSPNEDREEVTKVDPAPVPKRVFAFVDGFNLYHALDRFQGGIDDADQVRYRRYKWLNIWALIERFVDTPLEELVKVYYFTAYPTWDENKKFRHQVYVSALRTTGAEVIFGEFKTTETQCKGSCREFFSSNVEKQTDVNISLCMLELAPQYEKAILLTADSDQVPTISLLKRWHPGKCVGILPPVGRNSKELVRAGDVRHTMTEKMLQDCQFNNPIVINHPSGKQAFLVKPAIWP